MIRRASLGILVGLVLLGSGSLPTRSGTAAAAADDELVVEGPHVVVRSSFQRPATLAACRDALEAALPIYERWLPYRMPAGEKLEFRLCRDADEYRDALKALKLEGFDTNLAVTVWKPLISVVCLQPRADEAYLAAVGDLPEMTRHLVCHEGVHQWLRRAKAANVEVWPDWWGEGTAEWIAERCLTESKPLHLPISVEDATYRTASSRLHDYAVPLRRLLHADATLFERRDLVYHAFRDAIRLLAGDAAKFRTLAAQLEALPAPAPGDRLVRLVSLARAFEATLATTYGPIAALEQRLSTAPRDVRWFQAGRSFEWRGDEVVGASFADVGAFLLAAKPAPGVPFEVAGEIWFGGGKTGQIDLVLGYERLDDPRYVKIALGRGGYATRIAYASGYWQGRYKRNVDLAPTLLPEATWLRVRIRVEAERFEVRVGDQVVFESDVPPGFDVLHGNWGFGAYDSWAKFRGFEAKALPAK